MYASIPTYYCGLFLTSYVIYDFGIALVHKAEVNQFKLFCLLSLIFSNQVVASMVDANGQSSAAAMENFAAAAAAEPYESVRCAFMSYGSCSLDLAKGWKYRSRMWYGVGLFPKPTVFGGGGSGWESWKTALEKDSDGKWIELPLVRNSIAMLQALLLDESRLGSDLSTGGATFAGKRGVAALQQLLDSDQPFLCMLRMILASMREDDSGVDGMVIRNVSVKDDISDGLHWKASNKMPLDNNSPMSTRKPRSALLWRQAFLKFYHKNNLQFS